MSMFLVTFYFEIQSSLFVWNYHESTKSQNGKTDWMEIEELWILRNLVEYFRINAYLVIIFETFWWWYSIFEIQKRLLSLYQSLEKIHWRNFIQFNWHADFNWMKWNYSKLWKFVAIYGCENLKIAIWRGVGWLIFRNIVTKKMSSELLKPL